MHELDKIKIFGVGLTRTGTKSLAEAMRILEYKVKHSPVSVDDLREYDFLCDIIISSKYKFLDYVYPKAKFILTIRDAESWIRSNQEHASRYASRRKKEAVHRIPLHRAENRFSIFGITYFDEQVYREVQKAFEKEVYDYFNSNYTDFDSKLLVLDICAGEGWEKLCHFLGKEVVDQPFPRKNWSTYDEAVDEVLVDDLSNKKQCIDRETGIWSLEIAKKRHRYDDKLAEYVAITYKSVGSIADVGCGKGDYCKHLKDIGIPTVHGYEGTPNIKEIAVYDDIMVVDLTKRRCVGVVYDLVLCLEVGEHIPQKYEQVFIDNLSEFIGKDLIISWAIPGQGGAGHFNEQPNEYIIKEFAKRGLTFDEDGSMRLRNASSLKWFKNTTMKFKGV